ncbi:MAG: undecaprenyl-diphosphate phosphatase [Candidatus Azobacteroides sp.]|nr:undecaprenyl-diphosphate phosphatase [Candidatus Azobacteroides sp.]
MTWLQALILGIVQGLTEFLPISSSGHLAIFQTVMGLSDENLTFAIAVHAATVLSIITVFGYEIRELIQGLFKFRWNDETQYISKLLLSMIPVGIIGFCFKDYVEAIFSGGLIWVGVMLLLTAVLLILTYYAKPRDKQQISFKDAIIIGIAQAIAIFPGLSRSGTTISTGIFLGNQKENVTRFSFLMVIIPILGEAFLDLLKGEFSVAQSGISTSSLLIGFLAAYIFGVIACKWMLNLVKKGKLIYFAFYCIAVALIIFGFSIFNL